MNGTPLSTRTKPPAGAVRAFIASLTGTSLEYYDFACTRSRRPRLPCRVLPGRRPLHRAAALVLRLRFGYFARPIGGVIFGRLGDRIGRKKVLIATLLLIGIATVLIGFLPSYASFGAISSTLLVLLRLAQGIGVGGEWGGAVLLSSEFANPRNRGFWASAAQIGVPVGNLLANGVLALLAGIMTRDSFLDWGWRIAFLLSGVLVACGLIIRMKLEETPIFKSLVALDERPKTPLKDVFRQQPRALVAAALSRVLPDVLYSLLTVFVAAYATTALRLPTSSVLVAILIGGASRSSSCPWRVPSPTASTDASSTASARSRP